MSMLVITPYYLVNDNSCSIGLAKCHCTKCLAHLNQFSSRSLPKLSPKLGEWFTACLHDHLQRASDEEDGADSGVGDCEEEAPLGVVQFQFDGSSTGSARWKRALLIVRVAEVSIC